MLQNMLKLRHFMINPIKRTLSNVALCWNCNHSTNELFCPECNRLQKPPSDKNYFEILNIDKDFNVDESLLSKKLKDMQKLLHPDKFSNKAPEEQSVSEEYSSLVNKAYSTLLRPLSRGIYMLNLKGIQIEEKTQLESQFLHEIMERNEDVENASTPEEILKIEADNKKILNTLKEELNAAFKSEDMNKAKNTIIRMKYYESIDDQIKGIIRRMKIVK